MEDGHLDAQCTHIEKTGIIQERIQKHELDGDKENWVEDPGFQSDTNTVQRETEKKDRKTGHTVEMEESGSQHPQRRSRQEGESGNS
ncbi:uncharacterized protein DS421_18g630170 [Arachis hypogaea]|nr:uncharacterized protein DS421_18g630170 [Arachis hypogaea]